MRGSEIEVRVAVFAAGGMRGREGQSGGVKLAGSEDVMFTFFLPRNKRCTTFVKSNSIHANFEAEIDVIGLKLSLSSFCSAFPPAPQLPLQARAPYPPSHSPTHYPAMAPSLPPLRSWRSTIYAPSSQFTNVNTNASGAIESPASINHRFSLAQQQQEQSYESSVTELRRRLARKASTFSLRGKNRRSQRYLRELVRAEEKVQEAEGQQRQQQPEEDSETSSVVTAKKEGTDTTGTLPQSFTARFRNKNAPRPLRSHTITCVSMASESSPPPVPFARLEKIATEVSFLIHAIMLLLPVLPQTHSLTH